MRLSFAPKRSLDPARSLAAFAATCVLLVGSHASADVVFGSHDVRTVFFVAKSQNHNRVDYAVRLDAQCRPVGDEPVHAYWRLFEEAERLEPLEHREQRAYGIASQRVRRSAEHYVIHLRLRALPTRPIDITVVRDSSGRCQAAGTTLIRGQRAELQSVYVQLGERLVPHIEWIRIEGRSVRDAQHLRERIDPE